MKRILIIKLGALGDFVMLVGTMRRLKERYPDAEFTLQTHRSLVAIGQQMGMFSDFIIDNRAPYWNLRAQYNVLKQMWGKKFDLVINLQPNHCTNSYYYSMVRWFASSPFAWTSIFDKTIKHINKKRAFCWGKQREEEGRLVEIVQTDLGFLHGENKHFHELPERFVTLIPGCSPKNAHKRWPAYRFVELARRLAEHNIHSVVLGTKSELAEIEEIVHATPFACNMCGKTSLLDIPDLARRSLAAVGNDTGPSHMTALSGQPMIALFATRTKPCSIRGKQVTNIISSGTIDLITVDDVWDKLSPYLGLSTNQSE